MKTIEPWISLRTKEVKTGLKQIKSNYDKEPTASHIMELGVAYLWLQQYEKAWKLFQRSIAQHAEALSSFYGMAGAAKWCLGDISGAVRHWRDGLTSRYADTNGLGIHLPLLLLVASHLRVGAFESQSTIKLLEEKVQDRRVKDWPGPIARWVLGEINETELRRQCSGSDEVETRDRQWLCIFYQGVISYSVPERVVFKNTMQRLTDTSSPEWVNQDFFLARVWSEEFFLARHEAR